MKPALSTLAEVAVRASFVAVLCAFAACSQSSLGGADGSAGLEGRARAPVAETSPTASASATASATAGVEPRFAELVGSLSEPDANFFSDNYVSNETSYLQVASQLQRTVRPGGAYIGVGPEQNFSYIARLRPVMAFIIDIRRENRNLHLWYKALFELSADRADFVSRLFSRPRPLGLRSTASADEIFKQFDAVRPSSEQYGRNTTLVRERLLATRGLPLSQIDLDWIDHVSRAFYAEGPEIQFWGSRKVDGAARPSYRQLMTAEDFTGRSRSFLASEEGFRFVKDLHSRNLIVPVVGDFGGPTAISRVGDYVRKHADVVHAFYGSNVGVYLNNEQTRAFCRNLATLPAAPGDWFIEIDGVRSLGSKLKACRP